MTVHVSPSEYQEELVLRVPREDEEHEFLRAYAASSDSPFFASYQPGMRFTEYLERLAAQERGENLRPGQVPSTFLVAFAGTRIVGRVSIRHSLNESLSRRGGHIGYVVVPEFRQKGYATAILRMALKIARESLGIRRVLVTCDADNVGSIKTIERNGGVLESLVTDTAAGEKPFLRYWIDNSDGLPLLDGPAPLETGPASNLRVTRSASRSEPAGRSPQPSARPRARIRHLGHDDRAGCRSARSGRRRHA